MTLLAATLGVALASAAPVYMHLASADASPTGRQPKLLWTAERQAVWNRMRTDHERGARTLGAQWYGLVKDNAECACRYGDTGLWAAFMFQWTGERRYAQLAWAKVKQFIDMPVERTAGDYVREYGIEHVVLLDWLWPGLTRAQRTEYTDAIAAMLDNALNGNRWVDGYRLGDSDQVVGTYFAVVLFNLTNPDNVAARKVFGHHKNGGLKPTADEPTTARNAIKWYVERLAAGGEWIESAEYNLGTVDLLLMGAEALRTATTVDHFPEITQWVPQWGARQIAFWTPDLQQAYQWGDEEHPRERRLYKWTNASGLASGLLQGTAIGAQLQQHLLDLVSKYGATGLDSAEPIVTGRLFFTFNPYAPTADWRTAKTFHAPGAGLLVHRSGFSEADSLFVAHLASRPDNGLIDHAVRYLNDFELWRNGEWVLTHPRGYGGAPNGGIGTNAVLMHGFGDMFEFKELVDVAWGDGYAYQAGTTGGAAVQKDYYDPPPLFVHEWTRKILYLSGQTDTVVIHDRAHVNGVGRLDRYYPEDRTRIQTADSGKQWILHMPVRPSYEQATIRWSTPGGQEVTWSPLLPADGVRTIHDELALRRAGDPAWKGAITDAELKYHVRVRPRREDDWETFLNVVQVGSPGAVDLVSVADQIDGVRVSRPGEADVLALFNAVPGTQLEQTHYHSSHRDVLRRAHVRSSGFDVTWIARADETDIYLPDLDSSLRWRVTVDNQLTIALTPASSDVMKLKVNGAGAHTLRVAIANEKELDSSGPATPPVPTGLRVIDK
jgi:hypothetical protein